MSKLTLADFAVERLLGEGNMSRVFEARIKATNELVALKLVDKTQMERLAKRLEVLMEKHCLISLNRSSYRDQETPHAFPADLCANKTCATDPEALPRMHGTEHVCRLYHTFVTDTDVALVLELCSGQELWDAIKCIGIADPATLTKIWQQIEEALFAIHSHNIVHRDVKAENIVFKNDGTLKFADFGTAYDMTLPYESTLAGTRGRSRSSQNPRLKPRTLPAIKADSDEDIRNDLPPALYFYVGTPNFMGPESRQNHPEKDYRIDIWSLGCLLYQLTTGAPPFQAPSEFLVYLRAQNHDLDIPCYMNPDYEKYIKSCLADDIKARPTWDDIHAMTFTRGAPPCCSNKANDSELSTNSLRRLGDKTAIQRILRRRVVFYANLMIDFVKAAHPVDFPNFEDMPKSPRPMCESSAASSSQNLVSLNNGYTPRKLEVDSPVSSQCGEECVAEPDWKANVAPYDNVPVVPTRPIDVKWLQSLYPWCRNPSSLKAGQACVKGQHLVDAYALTPGGEIWVEAWNRLSHAVEADEDAAQVKADRKFCQAMLAAKCSDDLETADLDLESRMNLDAYVRCAFHALRELCTRERADNLYENWAKFWAPPQSLS